MRTDIPQMNPGKLAAQACHAQALFDEQANKANDEDFQTAIDEWRGRNGFGITIVLAATLEKITLMYEMLEYSSLLPQQYRIVVDPSYPITNYLGNNYVSRETTCMYLFSADPTYDDEIDMMLKTLSLHP